MFSTLEDIGPLQKVPTFTRWVIHKAGGGRLIWRWIIACTRLKRKPKMLVMEIIDQTLGLYFLAFNWRCLLRKSHKIIFHHSKHLTPIHAGEGGRPLPNFKPFSRKEKGWDEVFGESKFGLFRWRDSPICIDRCMSAFTQDDIENHMACSWVMMGD